jgi:hypothetical protein
MACHWFCVHNQSYKGGTSNASIQGNPAAYKGDTSIFSASEGDVSLGIKTDSSGISDRANLHEFAVSFVDVNSEQLNMQVHFDTDSIFLCLQQFNHRPHLQWYLEIYPRHHATNEQEPQAC